MKKIGILGCGWLGFSLGKELITSGYEVAGTSRNKDQKNIFEQSKIQYFEFQLGDLIPTNFINELDLLVISFPVTSKIPEAHLQLLINSIHLESQRNLKIIFTSSISVYAEDQENTDEETGKINPLSPNYRFEQLLLKTFTNQVTIVRLGGLIGEDRHPVFHLSGRSELPNGTAPINLVHRSDAISMIKKILQLNFFGHVYNCVYPTHPKKQDYYRMKAIEFELEPPLFLETIEPKKIVVSSKAINQLNFTFNFPI